ncbi:hypothetical protein ACFWAP_28315 [Streptomyces goshikiensis]|uniref:hypothetical protein n=1 Tax=Streptomyces goshikiensis TaxID=1942 RepID=UPI0036691E86
MIIQSADPFKIKQTCDLSVTLTGETFPDDLLQLQERLHRAHAEHRAYLAALP